MTITATELKANLGFYLEKAASENILITKNGKVIAQLSEPKTNKLAILSSLVGIAKSAEEIDLNEIREERLNRQ